MTTKKAIIISLDEDLSEMRSLLDTLDIGIVREYVQKRSSADRSSYVGSGKKEEIFEDSKTLEFDFVVMNGPLKPSQHHSLEMKFQKECLDRTGVILKIFSEHAHTPEALAQVTLARLRYEQPFLREWIHKAKSGERPGFLSGGAYATDVYYEHAKSHARKIEQDLSEIAKQREVRREKRRVKGYTLISLAGYTNAGKSSLMNALCGSEVEVDRHLFSTLSTTTRKVKGIKGHVLMTDTVGFISKLPTDLVNAFRSTLEEIFFADLIAIVFDASDSIDVIRQKLQVSLDIVLPKIEDRSLIIIGNKIDLLSDSNMQDVRGAVKQLVAPYEVFMVSAGTKDNLESFKDRIERAQGQSYTITADIPITDKSHSLISKLHEIASVEHTTGANHIHLAVRCNPEDAEKIKGWLSSIGATGVNGVNDAGENAHTASESSTGSEGAPPR
jgi:GTP-binding protein HflX